MNRDSDDSDMRKLLDVEDRTKSDSNSEHDSNSRRSSLDTLVFHSKIRKTSTHVDELAGTWGGQRSLPESGRLRRVHSWSGGLPDNGSSEIRILRERLVRTQTRLRPSALRLFTRHQKLTLVCLALVDFMSFCSMSVMAPFFPREASAKGLSDTMCGLVFSFYAVVMFFTSPLFGKFLPAMGAKFMFISGLLVAGVCNVLFGCLASIEDKTTFIVLCFVVRGLEALGASAYSTAGFVFVVNVFPDNIGSVLGILETFVGLGMSVGPAIGGILYSIGGFGLPFFSLGIVMVVSIPINFFLLTDCAEYLSTNSKTASLTRLIRIPSVIITALVIVIVSNTWAFLDPTLEPHLRQFGLSTEQIGLIFLLFSSLYGIFSPIWGSVADRVQNHWCMMVWGLFLSSVGLLLLGPCPFIPGLPRDLWLDLVALCILGISVALTLLPTFQGVLTSSIYEGGFPQAQATYSAVAGVWSCCYSLGEVLGPALGGALSQRYGFPLCATLCAGACFTIGIVTLTFFSLRESSKWVHASDCRSDSIPYTDTTWNSNFCHTRSAPETRFAETSPLLTPCSCYSKNGYSYGTAPQRHFCLLHKKSNKTGSASIADVIAYILKFQYVSDLYVKIRNAHRKPCTAPPASENEQLYQNYLETQNECTRSDKARSSFVNINNNIDKTNSKENGDYCSYLDEAIFGSPVIMENVNMEHIKVKRNNKGLITNIVDCDVVRKPPEEIIKHNIEKIHFYEQQPECTSMRDDIFDGCECRDGVTYVRGTVTVSSAGACEV
ncbi:hypothetical protein K1T71_003377 [Dendrolimus kikuchii]|uniref:Uncharacterized protein n=1 Tax=Dendrolimus kikuchii TaxID=765133 RepID=A0ACC1DBP3_9NEOP|nr:hypothetical protein K1T71_003377 [Dendrolimus kikuchii]